ncbi:MAG: hypothetical protein AAFX81_18830 [Pseudomonadota bacterium]
MSASDRPTPPAGFDDNPEWTAADTAAARRGAPWLWVREDAKARLREVIDALRDAPSNEPKTAAALKHAEAALQALDEDAA